MLSRLHLTRLDPAPDLGTKIGDRSNAVRLANWCPGPLCTEVPSVQQDAPQKRKNVLPFPGALAGLIFDCEPCRAESLKGLPVGHFPARTLGPFVPGQGGQWLPRTWRRKWDHAVRRVKVIRP